MLVEQADTRAVYGYTPTFVDRQNVGAEYGDNTQDFFLTASQNDWSLGEERRYADLTDDDLKRRYWTGTSVDPTTVIGQVSLRNTMASLSFGEAVTACTTLPSGNSFAAGATKLYEIDSAGTVTDRGAHGLGAAPSTYGMSNDGANVVMAVNGQVPRKWNGAA